MSELVEITGNKQYVNYKECKLGDVLVNEGTLISVTEGNFNKKNFEFRDGDKSICLNECGALKFNFNAQKIKIGLRYKIVYDGMPVMKKGMYAGKPFHQLKIFLVNTSGVGTAVEHSEDALPF